MVQSTKVSIGMPVRNGGQLFREALLQVLGQTHTELEIIISDNASSDETSEICSEFSELDSRIRYFRHEQPLRAEENFRFVFDKAEGDFFMWAAHDDRHSKNYVEVLLAALEHDPGAVLAFSGVATFSEPAIWRDIQPATFDCASDGANCFWRGLVRQDYIRNGYLHTYGLIRRQALATYYWPTIELAADRVLLLYLWRRGRFLSVPGACFFCFKPQRKKTVEQRARYVTGRGLQPFPYIRLSWVCAKAAQAAELENGRQRSIFLIFLLLVIKEAWKKSLSYTRRIGGQVWRGLKGVRA